MTTRLLPTALLLLLGCGHSDSFIVSQPIVGPFGSGADIQLTFNVEQDYWPAWTQDGRGILYSYVNPGSTAGIGASASWPRWRNQNLGSCVTTVPFR